MLWIGLTGVWFFLGVSALTSDFVQKWWLSLTTTYAPSFEFDPRKDPVQGTVVALPVADALGRNVSIPEKGGQVCLVIAGPCSDCSISSLNPESVECPPDGLVIFVYTTPAEELARQFGDVPAWIRIIADPGSKLANQLNAAWFPRFYLLDGRLRIQAIQASPNVKPGFVHVEAY